MHQYCPVGKDSWCGWQKQQAGVAMEFNHTDTLPKAVLDAIRSLYFRLTDRDLLARCTRGATQNSNECFNGLLWKLCPKELFCSASTVETAVYLAVTLFNNGATTIHSVLSALHCDVGYWSSKGAKEMDKSGLYHSARKSTDKEKKARKKRRAIRKGLVDAATEKKGVTYEAG
eukprot:scpid97571/ scgid34883/ 